MKKLNPRRFLVKWYLANYLCISGFSGNHSTAKDFSLVWMLAVVQVPFAYWEAIEATFGGQFDVWRGVIRTIAVMAMIVIVLARQEDFKNPVAATAGLSEERRKRMRVSALIAVISSFVLLIGIVILDHIGVLDVRQG